MIETLKHKLPERADKLIIGNHKYLANRASWKICNGSAKVPKKLGYARRRESMIGADLVAICQGSCESEFFLALNNRSLAFEWFPSDRTTVRLIR